MVITQFHTIIFLVAVLMVLNIVNRIVFIRFMRRLPGNGSDMKINDLLDVQQFEKLLRDLDPEQRKRATRTRTWLIRIILAMAVVIISILITGVFLFFMK